MANRWIVSDRNHVEHATPALAQAEALRLMTETGKECRVYRVKTNTIREENDADFALDEGHLCALGDKVKDKLTGFVGVAIGRTTWLYGCNHVVVESQEPDKDGNPRKLQHFDEQRIEVLSGANILETAPLNTSRPGGPPSRE